MDNSSSEIRLSDTFLRERRSFETLTGSENICTPLWNTSYTPPPPEKTIVEKEKDRLFEESLPDIHEVWNRTYDCQAGAIRIGSMTKNVLEACDEAGKIQGTDDQPSRPVCRHCSAN